MNDTYKKIESNLLKQGKFHISLELDRIKSVLNAINNPQEKLKVIHVAGTNGKGSTCKIISDVLKRQGYKVGLYTSPHLKKYNERITINNNPISDSKLFESIQNLTEITNKLNLTLTEFEMLTAIMYSYFYEENVDYAVIEVGLGGRYDATNCISKPLISIITSVSYDHTDRLGKTIEKIAFEKAGIIKENCPVIFNKNNLGLKVLTKIANDKKSKIYYPKDCEIIFKDNKNIAIYDNKEYEFNLYGKYQKDNISLALCAIEVLKEQGTIITENNLEEALKNVCWRGRFEHIKSKNLIIDGCHNPDGAKSLRESLDFYFPTQKRTFLYTSLKNKDYKLTQQNLFRPQDTIYHFDTKSDRFIEKKDIKNCVKSIDIQEIEELINKKRKNELLIICGSLYAIGDILGRIELCNS